MTSDVFEVSYPWPRESHRPLPALPLSARVELLPRLAIELERREKLLSSG